MASYRILPLLRNKLDYYLIALPVLYVFSDFLYLVLYYVVSYRRKVVATNLKNSFSRKN